MATPAVRNNNPGNLKDPKTGTFRQFPTQEEGYAALLNDLEAKRTGNTRTGLGPKSSLSQFASVYAPAGDDNDPVGYSSKLATALGATPQTPISQVDIGKMAVAIAKNEDPSAQSHSAGDGFISDQQFDAMQGGSQQDSGFISDSQFDQMQGGGSASGGGVPYTPLNAPDIPESQQTNPLEGGVAGGLIEKLSGRTQDVADTFNQPSLARGLLRTGGAIAGGIGDIVGAGISAITPDAIEKPVGEAIGKTVAAIPGVQGAMEAYGNLDPELRKDIGAVGNIASLVPIGKGIGLGLKGVSEVVPSATRIAAGTGGLIGNAAKQSLIREAEAIVSPRITPAVAKRGIKAGRGEKSGLLGEVSVASDPKTLRAAEASAGVVRKGKTFTENANALRNEIGKTAQKLETDLDALEIAPIVQRGEMDGLLERAMREIGENPTMVGDAAKSADLILKKFKSFLPAGDITAANLLKARKQLDSWMSSLQAGDVFNPNYETAKTVALRAIRQEANNLIAAKAPSISVKESLARQSALYDALENVSAKAAKEVGTTGINRFMQKHPGVAGLLKVGGTGVGAGLGISAVDDLFK